MGEMASQLTGASIVCLTICTGAYQRKHQTSASLAFVRGIHRWPMDSPHKGPVTRKSSHLMTSSCKGRGEQLSPSETSHFFNSLRPCVRVTHICVSNLTIMGSDNGLSPVLRQAIIWINARILLIGASGTNFSEISIEIHTFPFKKMQLKMSSGKWRPSCLGLNVLRHGFITTCFVLSLAGIHAS